MLKRQTPLQRKESNIAAMLTASRLRSALQASNIRYEPGISVGGDFDIGHDSIVRQLLHEINSLCNLTPAQLVGRYQDVETAPAVASLSPGKYNLDLLWGYILVKQ